MLPESVEDLLVPSPLAKMVQNPVTQDIEPAVFPEATPVLSQQEVEESKLKI